MAESEDEDWEMFITPQCSSSQTLPNFRVDNLYDLLGGDALNQIQPNAEEKERIESFRFGEPMKESEVASKIKQSIPKSTLYKDAWAIKMFEDWCNERNIRIGNEASSQALISKTLLNMTNRELNNSLSLFIMEARKANGDKYPPNTLHGIIAAVQHHLKQEGHDVSFFNDPEFAQLRSSLDAAMKEAASEGLGNSKKQAEVITLEEEEQLWNEGVLGHSEPQQLLDTVVYLVGIHFALRGGQEHRRLRRVNSQITTGYDNKSGLRFLQYQEDTSKTNGGGLKDRKVKSKVTRAFENPTNRERCIVWLYEKYLSLCPVHKSGDANALYLTPLKQRKPACWYSSVPVGHNKLATTVKRLCDASGLPGYRTNHSLRATAATRLYDVGVDEQLICEKTGHRSSAVRAYKRTSTNQEVMVSNILYGCT